MKEYHSPQVDIILYDENFVYTNSVIGGETDPWDSADSASLEF